MSEFFLFSLRFRFQALNNPYRRTHSTETYPDIWKMSAEYEGKDPLELAKQAEQDINSYENKTGNARAGASDECDRS